MTLIGQPPPAAEEIPWPPQGNSDRHAVIDGDIVAYQCAFACEGENVPDTDHSVDHFLKHVVTGARCDTWEVHLTGEGNFREEVATIQPYKGNRAGREKPAMLPHVRKYMQEAWGAIVHNGIEADDALSITHHYSTTPPDAWQYEIPSWSSPSNSALPVLCTMDKDLKGVMGAFLYDWSKNLHFNMEPMAAREWFYTQCLTGDSVDHIKGLSLTMFEKDHMVPPWERFSPHQTKEWIAELGHCETEQEMYGTVLDAYAWRHLDLQHWEDSLSESLQRQLELGPERALRENARLLHMLEYPGQIWEPPKGDL